EQFERMRGCAHEYSTCLRLHLTGWQGCCVARASRVVNLHANTVKRHERARLRRDAQHLIQYRDGIRSEIYPPVCQRQLWGERDVALLGASDSRSCRDGVHNSHQQLCTGVGQRLEQMTCGLVSADRLGHLPEDVTGVELGDELEDRGTR